MDSAFGGGANYIRPLSAVSELYAVRCSLALSPAANEPPADRSVPKLKLRLSWSSLESL